MPRIARKLPLTALRTFEVAARRLSFKDAADELCVSATTVSNQIRQLEADWQCKLFIRKTRAVVLTDEGRSLSYVLTRAFDEIRAEIEIHMNLSRKRVTLAVGPIFGSRWLVPRLRRFRQKHPKIELVLQHGPRITNTAMMTADLAVDWGTGDWSGLNSQKLMDITYSPVARADLIEACGGLETPADLVRFSLIHQRNKSEWSDWLRLAGCAGLEPLDDTTIRDSNTVAQAALEGQGVSLGVFPFMQKDVDAGRLVKPFNIDLSPSRAFFLLSRPGSRRTSEISAVQDWILAEIKASSR